MTNEIIFKFIENELNDTENRVNVAEVSIGQLPKAYQEVKDQIVPAILSDMYGDYTPRLVALTISVLIKRGYEATRPNRISDIVFMYGNLQRYDVDTGYFTDKIRLPESDECRKDTVTPLRNIKRFVVNNHTKLGLNKSTIYTYFLLHGIKDYTCDDPNLQEYLNAVRGLLDVHMDCRLRTLNYWMSANTGKPESVVPKTDEKLKGKLQSIRVHDHKGNYKCTVRLPIETHGAFRSVVYQGKRYQVNTQHLGGPIEARYIKLEMPTDA